MRAKRLAAVAEIARPCASHIRPSAKSASSHSARAQVLSGGDVVVRDIGIEELRRADEVFLTSSLRGIVPVAAIGATTYAIGTTTRSLQAQWRAQGWMI